MATSLSLLRAAVEAVQSSRDDIVAGHKEHTELAAQDSRPNASSGDDEMKASEKPEPGSNEQAFRTPEKKKEKIGFTTSCSNKIAGAGTKAPACFDETAGCGQLLTSLCLLEIRLTDVNLALF